MNKDECQRLILLRMSVEAIRRQINERLDALEMEITRLLPEEEGRGRRKPTLEEMRKIVDKACQGNSFKGNKGKRR